jgi:tetratricopeptide (TPR) repeat protein
VAAGIESDERLPELWRLLEADERPLVLFGAGVSRASPSSLPTAADLVAKYDARLRERLGVGPDRLRVPDDWAASLRFEELLSVFERIRLTREALAPLDGSRSPNENHRILASLYMRGWPLVTTNFDVLAEIAILEAGGALRQVVDDADYRAADEAEATFYKLHGSFWKWTGEDWIDSAESIRTTLEDVGGQHAHYMRNGVQKMRLVRLIRQRPLVVVGYSGSDDFDIAPIALQTPRRQPLVWVQHDDESWLVARSMADVPEERRALVPSNLFEREAPVRYVCGSTSDVLRRLARQARASQGAPRQRVRLPPGGHETALPEAVFSTRARACAFLGMATLERSRRAEAIAFLAEAFEAVTDDEPPQFALLVVYEFARAHLHTDDEQALRWALTSTEVARKTDARVMEAASLDLCGTIAKERSISEAISFFEHALALMRDEDEAGLRGGILANLGDSLWKAGEQARAYSLLVDAATILESAGLLELYAKCQHKLGIWCIEAGFFAEAEAYLRSAQEILEKLGDLETAIPTFHELGIIEQRRGDLAKAEQCFETARERAERAGDDRSRALAEYQLGAIALVRGEVERAGCLEKRSSETLARRGERYYLAHNLQLRATLHFTRGEIAEGRRVLEESLAMAREVGDAVHVNNCQAALESLPDVPEGTPLRVQMIL